VSLSRLDEPHKLIKQGIKKVSRQFGSNLSFIFEKQIAIFERDWFIGTETNELHD